MFSFHNYTLAYNADMFIDCTLNYFLVKSQSFFFRNFVWYQQNTFKDIRIMFKRNKNDFAPGNLSIRIF